MFYRIVKAPPGYAPDEQFMVASYESLDFSSTTGNVTARDGSRFAPNDRGRTWHDSGGANSFA